MTLVEFDYLVTKDRIEEGENFKDFLNPVVRSTTRSRLLASPLGCVLYHTGAYQGLQGPGPLSSLYTIYYILTVYANINLEKQNILDGNDWVFTVGVY